MIFDTKPTDWKDLQRRVHQAFIEMRCYAEEPKTITLVRGNKEIDVYVEDVIHGIKNIYLIECKYWNSDIPQEIVHGFRTIISDSGANKGIIIAKSGFQSGAFEASQNSPIELMTWNQFNTTFFKKWLKAAQRSIREKTLKLVNFRNMPYGDMCDEKLVELTKEEHMQWLEYTNDFMETIVLAGVRNILDELHEGPVRILRPGSIQIDKSSIEFWEIKTHREWYDYIVSQLDHYGNKVDAWMDTYKKRISSEQ